MVPKILFVGNCQVRPIESLLKHLSEVKKTQNIIVHLANNSERVQHEKLLNSADVIISQQIHDNYRCETVRSSIIKERHQKKIIFIPNLFYKGYTPDLCYLRLRGEGTLNGPLGDYHSSIILNSWKDGISIEDTIQIYRSSKTWKNHYWDVANDSLAEYKQRESSLDIKLTKFIENNLSKKQLFFTFNHPSKLLIIKLVEKIATYLELKRTGNSITQFAEPLNLVQVPIHRFTQKQLELKFDGPTKFHGVSKCTNEKQTYRLKKLVTLFFQKYENNKNAILERGIW